MRPCAGLWPRAGEPRPCSRRDDKDKDKDGGTSALLGPAPVELEWRCCRPLPWLTLAARSTLELTLLRRRDCRILSFLLSRTDKDDDDDDLPLDLLLAAVPRRRSPSSSPEEDDEEDERPVPSRLVLLGSPSSTSRSRRPRRPRCTRLVLHTLCQRRPSARQQAEQGFHTILKAFLATHLTMPSLHRTYPNSSTGVSCQQKVIN